MSPLGESCRLDREVAHPHRLVVGLGQVHEHLVVAEREAGRCEVGLEGVLEVGDGFDEGAPGEHSRSLEWTRGREVAC